MNALIAWFAENKVTANLLMMAIVAGGLFSLPAIRQEVFPEVSLDMVTISMIYPGASPEEVEEGICIRIEEQIQGVDGIKRVTSTATEGLGAVTAELSTDADMARVLNDIQAEIDAITTFPEDAEEPVIAELTNRQQVISVAVSGRIGEATLKEIAGDVRDDIAKLPGITLATLSSVRPYEIAIEVSEASLRRHGLTFDQVVAAVRRSSLDLPAGSIKTAAGEVLVRTEGQAYRGDEFARLVLLTRPDGTRLLLGDVAEVVDGFADTDQLARFNGERAAHIDVFRVGKQRALEVSDKVRTYVAEAQHRMPAGVSLTPWRDSSTVLRSRLDLMFRNGRNGFILVFLVLAMFLRFRLAFWVGLGIPISFLGALMLMPPLDVSINLISAFAFIIVLGIVVDDAIIVGENIFTHMQRGKAPLRAAIDGTVEVAVPVLFAIFTTVAAFSPLLSVPGSMGKFMRVVPIIVISTLVFSLVESQLVLPAHLGHGGAGGNRGSGGSRGGSGSGGSGGESGSSGSAGKGQPSSAAELVRQRPGWRAAAYRRWRRLQSGFADGLVRFIDRVYRPLLRFALDWRYGTVAVAVATLLVTLGLVASGLIRFTFFPPVEADYVSAMLTMPQGTSAETTASAVARLEDAAFQLRDQIDGGRDKHPVFRHFATAVGEQPYRAAQGGPGTTAAFVGSHLGEVTIELTPAEKRDVSSSELANRWREAVGVIPDAVELAFTSSIFSAGDAIDVQLTGNRLESLRDAAEFLKARLTEYTGVYDVADSFRAGKHELRLDILPEAQALGLTLADLARQVRQGFYGEEAQRIQRGRDDVKVMVRYPAAERRSLGDLENMRIRTPLGGEVPFRSVAAAVQGRGYDVIRRAERARAVNVTADVDPSRGNANQVLADLNARVLPEMRALYPGVNYTFEGENREQRETMAALARGFLFALVMIYALMAIPFKSYIQPLIVMLAIPFGVVGAIWGHLILGLELTILSMFGIVALTGVVVNDSLVLVDFVNTRRRAGATVVEAVWEAGAARFRPILLTSLTTFAGLTPLLLERSMQAKFLVPMAVSLAFGVIFATFITLLLIPAGYLILEDLRRLVLERMTRRRSLAAEAP